MAQAGAPRQDTLITEEAWIVDYKPVLNHIDENAGWVGYDEEHEDSGCLFETFGAEEDYIRSLDPHMVWTLVEGDNGEFISNGLHFVNRLGYFVTREPWVDGASILVELD